MQVRAMLSRKLKLHRAVRGQKNRWLYGCRQHDQFSQPESNTLIIDLKEDGRPIMPKTALDYCHKCWSNDG